MEKLEFRTLRADEIDCRVATINEKGLSLLLYKDARCDMNILDETVGCMNWKREHTRDNANCIVSLYNEELKEWVSKEDTGTESFTEKEKGLASDSFKRACFNWGIGRELYTAPFIWVSSQNATIKPKGDKYTTTDTFKVLKIEYNDKKEIIDLQIINAKTGEVVYKMNGYVNTKKTEKVESGEDTYRQQLIDYCRDNNINMNEIAKEYKLNGKSTEEEYKATLLNLKLGE